jgi:hypothetical protein
MCIRSSDQFTSLASYSTSLRPATLGLEAALTILITSHKLCHYFDTYPIEVIIEFLLGISCAIKMPAGASSNGLWSLAHIC